MKTRTRIAVVGGFVVALVAIGATGAVAHWAGTGTGTTSATTASTVAVTLGAGSVSADLYPGGSASVSTIVTNRNDSQVRIAALALDTGSGTRGFAISGDTPAGGCLPASLGFTTQTAGWTLGSSSTTTISLPNAITMSADAASACQGATIVVYLVAGS